MKNVPKCVETKLTFSRLGKENFGIGQLKTYE